MRTAEEMADFYISLHPENVQPYLSRNACVKYFESIAESLRPSDEVLYAFAVHNVYGRNGQSLTPGVHGCGVVFTADRCIFAQKAALMGDSFHSVLYDNFSDIRIKKSLLGNPRVIIDFLTEEASFEVGPDQVNMFFNAVTEIIENYRKSKKENQTTTVVMQTSAADELKKFKELLDMGVITQEEFDAKKKQLLGL